jgi:hypothetical protein
MDSDAVAQMTKRGLTVTKPTGPEWRTQLDGLAKTMRGDRGAEEADPERQVLHERTRPGKADTEGATNQDFEQRQHDHRGERQSGDSVLDRREKPVHFCVPAGCCLR